MKIKKILKFLNRGCTTDNIYSVLSYHSCLNINIRDLSIKEINEYLEDYYLSNKNKNKNEDDHEKKYDKLNKDIVVFSSYKNELKTEINDDNFELDLLLNLFNLVVAIGTIFFAILAFAKDSSEVIKILNIEDIPSSLEQIKGFFQKFLIFYIFVYFVIFLLKFRKNSTSKRLTAVDNAILILKNIKENGKI